VWQSCSQTDRQNKEKPKTARRSSLRVLELTLQAGNTARAAHVAFAATPLLDKKIQKVQRGNKSQIKPSIMVTQQFWDLADLIFPTNHSQNSQCESFEFH
jgi:hypothetical protein